MHTQLRKGKDQVEQGYHVQGRLHPGHQIDQR